MNKNGNVAHFSTPALIYAYVTIIGTTPPLTLEILRFPFIAFSLDYNGPLRARVIRFIAAVTS